MPFSERSVTFHLSVGFCFHLAKPRNSQQAKNIILKLQDFSESSASRVSLTSLVPTPLRMSWKVLDFFLLESPGKISLKITHFS